MSTTLTSSAIGYPPSTPAVAATPASAVSWGAVLSGAAAAAALSLILLALGSGLGFSASSPWSGSGASATAIGFSAVLWMIFTAAAASGLGGYLAGRLRTRWADLNRDEVFFRDTAHGFLAWAIATLLTAALLTSAATTLAGRAAEQLDDATSGEQSTREMADLTLTSDEYFVDLLFRTDKPNPDGDDWSARVEVGHILAVALRKGGLSDVDRTYLTQLVMRETGATPTEAAQRVNTTMAQAQAAALEMQTATREAADAARKLAAKLSLWIFISLLIGAFFASLLATVGGRQRDQISA